MKESIVINFLDQYQQAAMHIAEAQVQVRELNKIIDEQIELLGNLKHDILALLTDEPVEEPDPNSDPEGVPPVTDMEEVKMLVPVLKSAIRVAMRNRMTGEEREFKSKNQAAKFLNVSYPKMNDIIAKGGMYGDWNVTLCVHDADSPTA